MFVQEKFFAAVSLDKSYTHFTFIVVYSLLLIIITVWDADIFFTVEGI